MDMSTNVHGFGQWITTWIEPASSPAVTGRCYHPTEIAAELFAGTLMRRGVRQVVVYRGPDTTPTTVHVPDSSGQSKEATK